MIQDVAMMEDLR